MLWVCAHVCTCACVLMCAYACMSQCSCGGQRTTFGIHCFLLTMWSSMMEIRFYSVLVGKTLPDELSCWPKILVTLPSVCSYIHLSLLQGRLSLCSPGCWTLCIHVHLTSHLQSQQQDFITGQKASSCFLFLQSLRRVATSSVSSTTATPPTYHLPALLLPGTPVALLDG